MVFNLLNMYIKNIKQGNIIKLQCHPSRSAYQHKDIKGVVKYIEGPFDMEDGEFYLLTITNLESPTTLEEAKIKVKTTPSVFDDWIIINVKPEEEFIPKKWI